MKLKRSLIRLLSIALLTTLIISADPPPPVGAASIIVNTLNDSTSSDGYCSLREAIVAARHDTPYLDCTSGSGDDLITFSVSGTIHLSSALTEVSYSGGSQALTIDGGNNIIIDGDNVSSILWILMEGDNTLENIELTDGTTGIDISGGTLTLDGVTLSQFSAYGVFVGASTASVEVTGSTFHSNANSIYNTSTLSSLSVENSTFENNSGGRAISQVSDGLLTVNSSSFLNNASTDSCPAIQNYSSATITNSTFSGNSVTSPGSNVGGGAICNGYGTMLISGSTFDGNTVSGEWAQGGAVMQGNCSATDELTIEDSLFINNSVTGVSSAYGGAIYVYTGTADFSNLTIVNNTAVAGGAIFAYNASWTGLDWSLHNSTIYGNTSAGFLAGSVYCFDTCSDFDNNIFAGSLVGDNCSRVSGIPGSNITTDSSCSGATVVDESNLGLEALGDYGGPTHTMPLLPGSPAIDTGNNGTCASTDQRGIARPQGSACDIGAYESRGFTIALTAGNDQSTLINTAFPTPLGLSISGVSTEPVDGGKITFTAPGSGASTTFAPTASVTITGGSASLPVTANGVPGSYSLSASAAGANPTIYYDLENIDSAPSINDNPGFYVPSKYRWYLKTDRTDGWGGVTSFGWGGVSELIPVTGDWNGDGMDTAAFYKPSQWRWYIKNDQVDGWAGVTNFQWGGSTEMIPIAGDWDGDGDDTVGFYKPSTSEWYLKDDNTGGWTGFTVVVWGGASENIPIAGDWNGDGYDTIGFFVPSANRWWLKNDLADGWAGVSGFTFGTADPMDPVVGDWDGDGVDTVGGYVAAKWRWFLKDDQVSGWSNVSNLKFGVTAGYEVIAGDWE